MTSTKVPIVEDLKAISVITNYMGATYSFLYRWLGLSNFGTRRAFYGKNAAGLEQKNASGWLANFERNRLARAPTKRT